MRKLLAVTFIALVALGACSSDSNDAKTASVDKNDPAVVAVCETRDQVQLAVNAAVAVPVEQFPQIITGLERAIEVAPTAIRRDFVTVHDALKPFIELLVKAHGDQTVAAQDPSFQQIAAAVSTREAKAAAVRVRKYYAKNC